MAIDKTGLLNYVEQNKSDLLLKVQTGAPSLEHITKMFAVKGDTTLNLLNTNVTLRQADCTYVDGAGVVLSQRTIKAKPLTVNQSYCVAELENTYLQQETAWKAGAEKLPFAEKFAQSLVDSTVSELEKVIWQGGVIEGFKSFYSEYNLVSLSSTTTYDQVIDVVENFTSAVYSDTPYVYMGSDTYAKFLRSLKDLGHVDYAQLATAEGLPNSIIIPYTQGVRAVSVPGLLGTKTIFGTFKSNFVFGTDVEDGWSSVDLWYSKDNQQYRSAIKFVAGVQVAFPDLVWTAQLP